MSTSSYVWAPGDFYSTLRAKLKPLIPRHGPTAQFRAMCFATLALWLLFWSLAVSQGSFAFAVAAGWMMHALMGIGFVLLRANADTRLDSLSCTAAGTMRFTVMTVPLQAQCVSR